MNTLLYALGKPLLVLFFGTFAIKVPVAMNHAREAQLRAEQAQAELLHRHEQQEKRRAVENQEEKQDPPVDEEP